MNEYIQVDTNKSILDTYLANFIEEVERYRRPRPDGSIDWNKAKPNIIQLIKVIGGKAYNRGVEDSLSKIPADRLTRELQTVGWNECRQQTIDNISKLLTI